MELRETLKSKSEEGDAYITEIEVRGLPSFFLFPSAHVFNILGCSHLSCMMS
jgi:hypothetical protein